MNKQEQLSAVRKALMLIKKISELQKKLNAVRNQSVSEQPAPPVRETIKSQYPEVKSSVKFSWVLALVPIAVVCILSPFLPVLGTLLFMLSIVWIGVYYFVIYKRQKETDVEKIRNSEQYRKQCADIDIETQRRQTEADEKYQAAMKEYNDVILPKYQRGLEEKQKQHEQEVNQIQQELNKVKQELSAHYEEVKIIPVKYRNHEALDYISKALSFSASDIDEAIDMWEEDCERKANISYDNVSFRSTSSNSSYTESPGILSGLAKSAMENAQSRSLEPTQRRSAGRESLWGTAMCPYGKKDEDGWTIRCPNCPLRVECGGKN